MHLPYIKKAVPKGPSIYYVSIILDFGPINTVTVLNVSKTANFLDPPTQFFADVIYVCSLRPRDYPYMIYVHKYYVSIFLGICNPPSPQVSMNSKCWAESKQKLPFSDPASPYK